MSTSAEILRQLRLLMRKHKLDYYFIPGRDPHQSEYVPTPWQRRAFVSGFTGSNGDVLVGLDQAYLWTDGRYTLQAKLEVDAECFQIFEFQQRSLEDVIQFLMSVGKKIRVGVDPQTISCALIEKFISAFADTGQRLSFLEENLVDKIWITRPAFKNAPATPYPLQYAGETCASKLAKLREFMQAENLDYLAINELSDLAWLFNIRGGDIDYSPLVLSYALISFNKIELFIAPESITPSLEDYCKQLNIHLLAYDRFYMRLRKVKRAKVGLNFKDANALMLHALKKNQVRNVTFPITLAKAFKNRIELEGAINAHIEDGIALCRFFAWLQDHWLGLNEVSLDAKLLEFRQQSSLFQEPSFETIAGYKDHGAIIHYAATSKSAYEIGDQALLLLDSGGQYLGGTTDVTRTIHLGTPTDFEKRCYTLVLKGHLALRHAVFAQGTRGEHLDVLARQFLWREGLDYAHGTGHGVGSYLGVHEGPQYISRGATNTPLLPNMLVSNEPGVYLEGQFGIRIENVCYVRELKNLSKSVKAFYGLEDLTLVPYCRALIDIRLLTQDEITWINAYHQTIFEKLSPQLDAHTQDWLRAACSALI